MRKDKSWHLAFVSATWVAFALIVILFDPVWSGFSNVVKSVIGLLGALISTLLLLRGRSWIPTSLVLAVLLIVVYVSDWAARVADYVSADPEFGVVGAVGTILAIPIRSAWKLAADESAIRAVAELYWTTGMPLLQLVIAIVLVYRLKAANAST